MAKHGDTKQRAAMAEREHRRNKRILRLLCFVVAIAVAFVAGFALRSQDQFLVSLGFSIPGVQKVGTQSADVKKSPYDSISARLSEVEDVPREERPQRLRPRRGDQGGLQGLLERMRRQILRVSRPVALCVLREGQLRRCLQRRRRPVLGLQRSRPRFRCVLGLRCRGGRRPAGRRARRHRRRYLA